MNPTPKPIGFPGALQQFFNNRLINQQNASNQTVASYRDTFRLFLQFIESSKGIKPSSVTFEIFHPDTIVSFLNYLEQERGNSIRTRNNRLAAIRAFVQFVAGQNPMFLSFSQRILAIPMKRFNRPLVGFLSENEMNAVLNAPDIFKWHGRRDKIMFLTLYNTGARVSEIISLRIKDISIQKIGFVTIHGKGRKERTVPLWKKTITSLKTWLKEVNTMPDYPLFPNAKGNFLSRSGVENRLKLAVKNASQKCTSLLKKNISPHTFRHTTAMHLLQSGVDISVIALWLGHESIGTTHMYIEADLDLKEKALKTLQEPQTSIFRYKPSDKLLQFLESL